MVLGVLNRWLPCVDSVIVGLHNLDWDLFGDEVSLDGFGAFVVKDVEVYLWPFSLSLAYTLLKAATMLVSSLIFIERNKIAFGL